MTTPEPAEVSPVDTGLPEFEAFAAPADYDDEQSYAWAAGTEHMRNFALPLLAQFLAEIDRAHIERDKLGREVDLLHAELASRSTPAPPDDAAEQIAAMLRETGAVDQDDDTMPIFRPVEQREALGNIDHWVPVEVIARHVEDGVRQWWLSVPATPALPDGAAEKLAALARDFRDRAEKTVVGTTDGEPFEDGCDSPAECHASTEHFTWKLAALQVEKLVAALSSPATDPEPATPEKFPLDISQLEDLPVSTVARVLRAAGMTLEIDVEATEPVAPQAPAEPTEDVAAIRAHQIAALTSGTSPRVDCAVPATLTPGQIRRLLLEARNLKDEGHHAGETIELLLDPKLGGLLDDIREVGHLIPRGPAGPAVPEDTATPDDAHPIADTLAAREAVLNAPPRWHADNPGLIPPDDYGDDLGGWAHRADTTRPADSPSTSTPKEA